MNNDYLWDRSGPPDPEIQRLEGLLAAFSQKAPALRPRCVRLPLAATAAILTVAAVLQFAPRPVGQKSDWKIAGVEGARLDVGHVVRTGPVQIALSAGDVGRVDVAPNSELRIVESGGRRQRLSLQRGFIHALIWAPPQRFVVDTPSARAIDLGCEYTLSVDAGGGGLIEVLSGWVAFQFQDREAFIPAGALCATSKRRGPGTPFYRDAPEHLRDALRSFDETGDPAALHTVLQEARRQDALTLWHLLTRAKQEDRPAVFASFSSLVALPGDVTREKAVANDPEALDACWNALHLEDTDWWRSWKRPW